MLRRIFLTTGLVLSTALSALAQTPNNVWTPAGPQYSTVLSMARNPASPGQLLAGLYFGGLYRSSDYGFSWTHVDAEFSSRSVFSIAYGADGTIYVATFQGGVFRSVDGGASWTEANSGLTDLDVQAVAVDPFNAQVVLAATSNGGIFRTVNGGEAWTPLTQQDAQVRGKVIAFHPTIANLVYLGTIGHGAMRSVDGGQTFEPFSAGLTAASVLSLRFGAPPSRELYASTDNGAFKLRGGAAEWTDITGDLPPYPLSDLLPHPTLEHLTFAATLVGVFVMPDDEAPAAWIGWTTTPTRILATDPTGSVYHAGSIHGGLQATVDFGQQWYQANTGIQNVFIGALSVVDGGSYGPVVFAGSDFAIHRSAFGAWETFFDQKQGIFDIQPDPTMPGTLYAGTERSGVWKSTDWGTSWAPSSTNIVPAQIFSLAQSADGKTLFAGTSSGLFLSPDSGNLWLPGTAAQLGIVLSIAPDPTRHPFVFAGGANGQVLRSEDGGWSFANASNGLPAENIISLVTAPWEKTYAITGNGGVFATSDNGLNWFPASTNVQEPASAIAADPVRPWILYLGTSGGGIYKSESGSLDWTARNTGLTSPYVFAVAVNPADPQVVYAGTFDGVFKSTNGAASWTRQSTGLPAGSVTAILVDATSSNVVYASVQDSGIFRSADGGASWTATGAMPAAGAMPMLIDRIQSSRLFAGTALNGVYRSTDSGASWSKSSFGLTLFVRGLAVNPINSTTLYAGSLGAGVFKSVDGAGTWTSVGLRDRNVFKLAIDPVHPDTVYAATSRGLSRTTNGGTSWRGLGQKAAFVHSMAIDPQDRRRIFVGTTAGTVSRSTDGGETWEPAGTGLPPFTVFALAIDPTTGEVFASPEGRGVWRTTNGGDSWTALPIGPLDGVFITSLSVDGDHKVYAGSLGSGVFIHASGGWVMASNGLASPQIADVESMGAQVLVAATFDAGVFRSTNGGDTWQWSSSGLTTSRVTSLTVDPAVANRIYAATPDGVFRSNDGGATWSAANAGMLGVNTWAIAVDPAAPDRLYAGTNGSGVFRSTDGGATWSATTSGLVNLDVKFVGIGPSAGSLYAATQGGGVARSLDFGQTWAGGITLDVTDNFVLAVVVNPLNPAVVYAGTAGRGVLKSTNGGVDWMPVSNGLGSLFILSMAIDKAQPDTVYAGTADSGVFVTTNGGRNWQPLNDGLFNPVVTSLAVAPGDSSRVYAGTEGGGVFTNRVALPPSTCVYVPTNAAGALAPAETTFEIQLQTAAGCPWHVESGADWLTVAGSSSRTGAGLVTITAAINVSQDARSGIVTVAGTPVVFVQQGRARLFRLSVTQVGSGAGRVAADWIGIECGDDCQQLYTDSLPVVLIATPGQGSTFAGWEGDADCTDGTVVMSADRACVARFELNDDFDVDGLPNLWEHQFGLDGGSDAGDDGASGDPDGDGLTNAQEFEAGTHPRGFVKRYFAVAEHSATSSTTIDLLNVNGEPARVLVHFPSATGEGPGAYRFLAAEARSTIDTAAVADLPAAFVVAIESDRDVVAERTIARDGARATMADSAVAAARTWYSTGGSTRGGKRFEYVVYNPGSSDATIDVVHLPSGAPVVFNQRTVPAGERLIINAGVEAAANDHEIGGAIASNVPVVVEALVVSATGDAVLGSLASSTLGYLQFLSAGQTGPLLTNAVSVLNPTAAEAALTFTYVLAGGGIVSRAHTVAPYASASFDSALDDALLANTTFGVAVNASTPFVLSGQTWWPGSSVDWYEGAATIGAPAAGRRWAIAGGEVGGPANAETELAITSVSAAAGRVNVKLIFDDGTAVARDFDLAAVSRITIGIAQSFPEAASRRFSAIVESAAVSGTAPNIVVEHASFTSPGGVPRAGGTRVTAALIPQ